MAASDRIVSERLQKKTFQDRFPDNSKTYLLLYFPEEQAYSVVSRKSVLSINPQLREKVSVKDAKGTYEGIVMKIGEKSICLKHQGKLERLLTTDIEDNEDEEDSILERSDAKKKRLLALESDSEPEDCGNKETQELLSSELKKVANLLGDRQSSSESHATSLLTPSHRGGRSPTTSLLTPSHRGGRSPKKQFVETQEFATFAKGVHERLDKICNTLESFLSQEGNNKLLQQTPTSTSKPNLHMDSPAEDELADTSKFEYQGINLINDIPFSKNKVNLYALGVFSTLFTAEEMLRGCIDPKEGRTNKNQLDEDRVMLLKQTLQFKLGEKWYQKLWPGIRTSLNQKCLDKIKKLKRKITSQSTESSESPLPSLTDD